MQLNIRSRMKFVATIGVLFLLSALPAATQTSTGAIHGTTTDQSGALLPGVNVTARNVATNLERNTTTDQDGFYQFLFLPIGTYEITAEATGFRRDIRQGIELQINQEARIDISLQVGDLAQEVIVTSAPPLVETSSSAVGDVIENARIIGMPLNGRNFQQLALLTAGTAPAQEGSTTEFFGTACGSIGISVNGGRDDQNHMMIDGITAIDQYFNTLSLCPSVDAVQEFKVLKNSYNADFGMFGAGQIIATIKSGGNQFHGNVFEFHRNHAFSAKNFFDFKDRDTPIFVQNQFGGTLGGPIKEDKTFFFFSFEALRVSQSETRLSALPTADQRTGLFVGELFDSELLTSAFPFTYTGAAGCETDPDPLVLCDTTTIPSQRFGTVANAMLALFPVPNLFPNSPGLNHVSVDKRSEERDQVIFRLDHQFSPNHLFFGRYIWARADQSQPFGDNILTFDPPPPPGFPTPVIDDSQNLAFGLTSILGPNLINEFRGGWNFYEGSRLGGNTQVDFATDILGLDPAALGLTAELPAAPIDRGYPNFHVAGLSQFGDGDVFNPLIRTSKVFQFSDDLAWTVGKHSFKFGGTVHFVGFDTLSNFFTRGFPNYDAVSLTGNFTADFLIDRPFAIVRTRGDTSGEFNTSLWGVYFTDSFRASSRLTINYGVRYEVFPPITEKNNRLALYDKNTQSIVIAGDTLPPEVTAVGGLAAQYNALIPFLPPFTLGPVNYVTGASLGLGRSLTKTDWKNWAPRLGLAYDLTGNGKTVIRASAGIYNTQRDWSASSDSRNMLPFTQQMVLVDLARLGVPIAPITFQDMFTGVGNVGGSGIGPQIDMPIGYFEQFSLTVQRELTENLVLEVAYVGTHGVNLNRLTTTNQEQLITGPLSGTPPNPQFGFFIQEASEATSSYNGGFIRVEKRISNGLLFTSSYTFAKSIDTVSSARENGGAPTREQDSACLECERALSNFDTRQRFVTSFTYELPLGRGSTGAAEKFLRGWQIAGIVSAQSGQPFTPQYPGGAGAGFRFPRPSQDCDPNLSSGQQTPNRWFNTLCFFAPSVLVDALANGALTVEPGTSGRNTLEGPGLATVDINFSKTTPLGEQANIEFRAEFFNLLNRANFNLPDRVFVPSCLAFAGDTSCRNINPNFGQVSSAKSARVIQFGLKVTF